MTELTKEQIEAYQKIGGEIWEKGERKRIYFNDLGDWFGLECEYFKSGNVKNAKLDGAKISNNKAGWLMSAFMTAKLYIDCKTGEFECVGLHSENAEKIIKNIKNKLNN